ncbi:MAG TPA: VOC family protein [Candidatus Aquilonibacter sp.]
MSVQSTPASATAVAGFDLFGATVRDLQKSLAFYRDALGLIPTVESENGVEFHLPDGSTFGLWQPDGDEMPAGMGPMFAVADATGAAKEIRERGGDIADPFESPVCYMAMSKDAEGNPIIIHQKKSPDPHNPPKQARTLTSINGIDLAGYLVEDPQAQIAFYRDVLGMTPTDIDDQGRGAEFDLADGQTFGVWRTPEVDKGGFVMFAVNDVRAKAAELRSRDVEFSEVEDTPVCAMAFGLDPEGNCVVIHQRKVNA